MTTETNSHANETGMLDGQAATSGGCPKRGIVPARAADAD